jgi:hypothetical protein
MMKFWFRWVVLKRPIAVRRPVEVRTPGSVEQPMAGAAAGSERKRVAG